MKKRVILAVALLFSFISINTVFAATNTWTQKADFGGTGRMSAVSFAIGNKGYIGTGNIGTGNSSTTNAKDFWEYDPATDIWTQKADFGGTARSTAFGFSIGSKGYIGTGYDNTSSYTKDFWEYDPSTNTWTQKADFGGGLRIGAVGFSIGSKGYVGTGCRYNNSAGTITYYKDFWEYDPSTDTWRQKADFGGTERYYSTGFSIGNKGYIGIGTSVDIKNPDNRTNYKDFWEYDPSADTWSQKADFGGAERYYATGFSIGNKGYIGTGNNPSSSYKNDFWEYDPDTNIWTQKTDFGGVARRNAVGLSIGNKGYIGTGTSGSMLKDFWEYETVDTTPDAFTFNYETGWTLNTVVTSNTITVSGINTATDISITGGTYSINGGAYTSESGTVANGDTVTVRVTSSGSYSTAVTAKLTIGGVSDTFTVVTEDAPADTTPDTFIFTASTGAVTGTTVTSSAITVSGITGAAAISITGGTYSINGGAYTSDAGTVSNGDTVTVQMTASSDYSTTTAAVLTIGGVSSTFDVTTASDPFYFITRTNLPISYGAVSNTVTVSWISGPAPISIACSSSTSSACTYSVNGGAFGAGSGTINKGDTVRVSNLLSGDHFQNITATLTIGGRSATFTASTSPFYLNARKGVELNKEITSDYIKILWSLNEATPISITGGTYSVGSSPYNMGGYTSASGTLKAKTLYYIMVKVASASTYATATKATLTIGSNSADFVAITKEPYGDRWTQKADFGGGIRHRSVGFSIGAKGYVGTGNIGSSTTPAKDFWEYDPATGTWTQKADFGGIARYEAVGFSIGSNGYIGTGYTYNGSAYAQAKDFWEYNPTTNTWTQKADFGGGTRDRAVGFSIGSKGYIGTGYSRSLSSFCKDFWEYDPATDTWTQKTDFGGAIRASAIGLSIGNKGYIGLAKSNGTTNDFWEYDPATDVWTQKAGFAGPYRSYAVGFSIENKGYVGTGSDEYTRNDFWEYDPATDVWTRRSDLPADGRLGAIGFSIGKKGYLGTGWHDSTYFQDFWEYTLLDVDPDSFSFTAQTNVTLNTVVTSNAITVSGIDKTSAISISGGNYSVNGGAYTSESGTVSNGDTVTVQITSSGSYSTTTSATLTIGGVSGAFNVTTIHDTTPDSFIFNGSTGVAKGTVITSGTITVSGIDDATPISITGGMYSINGGAYTSEAGTVNNGDTVTVQVTSSASNSATTSAVLTIGGVSGTFSVTTVAGPNGWVQKADFGGLARNGAAGFSIGNKGYIGTGEAGSPFTKDFWEYDPVNNTWTQKADFGGSARGNAVGLSIGDKGYIGTGFPLTKDFWEYDPVANTWTKKADFGGGTRAFAAGFSIGNKGYLGIGWDGSSYRKDFWEYDQAADKWTQKADYSAGERSHATGLSIGSKGYIGTGIDKSGHVTKDFWEYNPSADTWNQKADFGGTARFSAAGFSINNKGYIGTGSAGSYTKDFWEYDPATDTWTKRADYGGVVRLWSVGFAIGKKGYMGTGRYTGTTDGKDFWEYTPFDTTPDAFSFTSQTGVALNTTVTSNTITVSGINGATPISISGGTYSVNGGAYTSASGTLNNGDTVTVQLTSSADFSTTTSATLSIGGVSDTFVVTTISADTTPDSFSFSSQTGVALSTTVTSNTVTVSGINSAAAISISGGSYSINGGAYTSESGTVNNGDTVTIQKTSSGDYSTTTTATLIIGGVSSTFSVTTVADTTPDAFIFNGITDVATGTVITSGTITVSGINAATPISITGGMYSINGGVYTSASGTVNNGDKVTVQVKSSGSNSATTSAVLSIGGVSSTFSVNTVADTTPAAFSFTPQTGVALNAIVMSNSIAVSGIDAVAAISITGGLYSVNGGAYTNVAGTVKTGDRVTVQQTSSGSYSTTTIATLTIGGVSGAFSVTTKASSDKTPPSIKTMTPVNNSRFVFCTGGTPVSISLSATERESKISNVSADINGSAVNLLATGLNTKLVIATGIYTAGPIGSYTYTASAFSDGGRKDASVKFTENYTMTWLPPLSLGTKNKGGSTIPIKFSAIDCAASFVEDKSVNVVVWEVKSTGDVKVLTGLYGSGASDVRIDGKQYIVNFKTASGSHNYRVEVSFLGADGKLFKQASKTFSVR